MSRLIERAAEFAKLRHGEQKRKFSREPYWHHLRNVAEIVEAYRGTEDMIAAAWLHDVVEDTETSIDEVGSVFGARIRTLVYYLTDVSRPEDGNREARKQIDREHLRRAIPAAQTVKLTDLIDNSKSIVEHDKNFARVYLKEKERLLEVMAKADPVLREHAYEVLREAQMELVRASLESMEESSPLTHGGTWDVRFREATGSLSKNDADALVQQIRTRRRLQAANTRHGGK